MAKYKKPKQKNKPTPSNEKKGFDFGEISKVMALSDIEFNQKLRNSKIFGCAYGYHRVNELLDHIPCLTLIAEDQKAIEAACEHFVRWGCETDGDSVDIRLILKHDKSYEMWINPEVKRSVYRTIPQSDLFDTISMNVSYIKKFDSTNPFLNHLKEYLNDSELSPVLVTFALGNPNNLDPSSIKILKHLPQILKFDLKITDERNDGIHPIFGPKLPIDHPSPHDKTTPANYCKNRRRILDIAFPITRERVLASSLIDKVHQLTCCSDLSSNQITQACINLILSNELKEGLFHYTYLTSKNFKKRIWDHVLSRVEVADSKPLPEFLSAQLITDQIKLDILDVTHEVKGFSRDHDLISLQTQFRSQGFVDD